MLFEKARLRAEVKFWAARGVRREWSREQYKAGLQGRGRAGTAPLDPLQNTGIEAEKRNVTRIGCQYNSQSSRL